MKRAACRIVVLRLLFLALPAVLIVPSLYAQLPGTSGVLLMANPLRSREGLTELKEDPLLERTAAAYAADLARRGVLSHVDEQGRRALERFRDFGGTTVLVGEILGSGPDLAAVFEAWEASGRHRDVLFNPLWTHCGAAGVPGGAGGGIWVVLFTSHRIDALQIICSDSGYLIRGRVNPRHAVEPVLLSGVEKVDTLLWDSRSGDFSFRVSGDRGRLYHRLGYRLPSGTVLITNTFFPARAAAANRASPADAPTSDRERELR
ncbi:MAG: hypothetical protein JXB06_01445 [Spirochaetales bacterium]|nr:hypothetical protein [Spirochaetales bacterium]